MKLFCNIYIKNSMRYTLVIAVLLSFFGCSQGEPPLSLGDVTSGKLARQTKLIGLDNGPASLAPGRDSMKYEINYPAQNLKSIATVSLMFGNMREELFEKKWKVKYIYDGKWKGRNWHEAYGIPLSIEIYEYFGGSYSNLSNTYRLSKLVTNYPVYKNISGNEKTISVMYFRVSSGLLTRMQ